MRVTIMISFILFLKYFYLVYEIKMKQLLKELKFKKCKFTLLLIIKNFSKIKITSNLDLIIRLNFKK